jgi:type VI secretion system secreted protein VgrG
MSPRILRASEARFLFQAAGTELAVLDFTAHEGVSIPYEVNLTLVSEDEIKFDDMVGKEAYLEIAGEGAERYFHGILSTFAQGGTKGKYYLYQARMVPSLWMLSLEHDCRIFQEKNVQDIVKQILQDGGIPSDRFEFRVQSQYPTRTYCVQYRENDLQFVSRLLEEEGIFYFFEHSKSKHLLVFGDSTVNYKPIQGEAGIPYNPAEGMVPQEECVYGFSMSQQVHSGKFTQRDFNFERPSLDLTTFDQAKSYQKQEVYDYPGIYLDQKRGKDLAQIRLQELTVFREKAEGKSVCPRFTPGFTFKLTEHERSGLNREYFLIDIVHRGTQPQALQEMASKKEPFRRRSP